MRSRRLLKRALSDWPAKVLSLAAALMLFFFYRLNRLEDRYISVPLAVSLNEEFVPSSQAPRSVRITLRGESNTLFSIQEDDIRASLDLGGFRSEGAFRVPVQVEKLGSALGIDPLEIQVAPSEVAVALERRVTKTVPVTPSFRGFLEPGYELVSFDFTPPEVGVYGPASAVFRVADVPTDFIELAGRSADFVVKTRLAKKDSLVYLSGPDTVEFRAVVQKSLAIRSYPDMAIELKGLGEGLLVAREPARGTVRVRSSTSEIGAFAPEPGLLQVDLSGIRRPGTYTLPVTVHVPEGYVAERWEPQSIDIVVQEKGGKAP